MQLFGTGYMITFTEVAPGIEDDFNEWYNREHLDERIDLPGFRRAFNKISLRRATTEMLLSLYEPLYRRISTEDGDYFIGVKLRAAL